jgi:hypothetical protein
MEGDRHRPLHGQQAIDEGATIKNRSGTPSVLVLTFASWLGGSLSAAAQDAARAAQRPPDAAAAALEVRSVPADRPELRLSDHDRSDRFDFKKPAPVSPALKGQPNEGRISGFDFARDPLGADRPFLTLDEIMRKESAQKAAIMAAQRT